MRIFITGCIIAWLTVPGLLAEPATNATMGDVVQVLESILTEAQRQERVSGDMSAMIKEFRKLVEDLTSNGLLSDVKGQDLSNMADVLATTDRNHVQAAARKLRDAGAGKTDRKPNIAAATVEIQSALGKLKALLREANALRAGDMLTAEIERMIKDETVVMDRSMSLGKDILAGKTDSADNDLGKEQERIASSAGDLEKLLKEALANEITDEGKIRLQGADQIMTEERVKGRLDLAAESIEKKDLMAAVSEQKQAIDALRAMLKSLRPDGLDALLAAKETLQSILDGQKDVREKTSTTPEQFKTNSPALKIAQADLKKRLEDALKAMDQAKKDGMGKKGGKEDKKGEGEVKGGKKDPVPNSKATESKMKGTSPSGKGKASENNAPQEKKPEDGGSDPTEKPGQGAKKPMDDAEKALTTQSQPEAIQSQKDAEDALKSAIEQLEQQLLAKQFPGMPKGKAAEMMKVKASIVKMKAKPGMKPGDPELAKAMAELAAMQAPPMPPGPVMPPLPPGEGAKVFMKQGVYGVKPEGDKADINSMASKERDTLGKNFARQLPREYRDMLRAYYEKLAKE